MMTYQKFIAKRYLKNIFLVFGGLELFFVGMDLLQNLGSIANSANLQVLYTVNALLYYVNFTLPLSLVFAMLLTLFSILKSNELVSLYALGISKNELIRPIIIIASGLTLLYISLNFLPAFVNANEESKNIKKYGATGGKITSSLFLKAGDTYAYIDQLLPEKKEGINLKIFVTKEHRLVEILEAKSAIFKDNHWNLQEVTATKIPPPNADPAMQKLQFEYHETKEALYGFKPKIIDTLFQRLSILTIPDSIEAIALLKAQNLNSSRIKANLYTMLFFPLFAPIVVYGLFFPLPPHRRGVNIPLLNALSIFSVLIVWGILFTLTKFSANGSFSPETAIVAPIFLLFIAAWFLSHVYKEKHL